MAEKKYKGRKAYLNDFRKNEQGEYEYQGNLYEWQGEKKEYLKNIGILLGCCVIMLTMLVLGTCLDAPGALNCIYVMFPAAISLVFGISVAWGIGRLCFAEYPMRAYIYEATFQAIPFRSMGTMISAGITIVGEVMYLLLHGIENMLTGAVILILAEGIGLLFGSFIRKTVKDMAKKTKNLSK